MAQSFDKLKIVPNRIKGQYFPTIGLEIHCELKTKTKMFCRCLNDPDEKKPNVNVCPICLAHPGVLPTINKEAVDSVIKLGLALSGEISKESHFDRKSYFYPDLPKGYQISQYEKPLVIGGILNNIRIRRIHLEEDTGRLIHEIPNSKSQIPKFSLVDFNRAGMPLMELVTEPDIKSAKEAVLFTKELRLILRYLDISEANMEKGELRLEANISVSKDKKLGIKVEIKNLNSFRGLEEAINYEINRQTSVLESGGLVEQETRGWDDIKRITKSQRFKESAHDYRYFPEPDLPIMNFDDYYIESLKKELPELPFQKRERFKKDYGLNDEDMEIIIEDKAAADFFEKSASELKTYNLLANYFTSDLRGLMIEKGISISEIKISPINFSRLVALIEKGKLSSRLAKDLIRKMAETGQNAENLIKSGGLKLISSEAELEIIIKGIIEKNPKAVEDYKKGKANALQFLIGQAMAKTKGQAEPESLRNLFEKILG